MDVLNFNFKTIFMNRILLILLSFLILTEIQFVNAQQFVTPGAEWSKTRHLDNGDTNFKVLFARTGWETQESGTMSRKLSVANDTIQLIREISRGNASTQDTLLMHYPDLTPITFSAKQKDRITKYQVDNNNLHIHIDFTAADILEYSQDVGDGFFDLAALDLVLGGLKRRELQDKTLRLFDAQTSSFINFTVSEVSRERIEDGNGKRQRCFLIKGQLNNSEASYWVHRRSGELIKSKVELSGQMAMILLRQ